jgi:hypothetical protein
VLKWDVEIEYWLSVKNNETVVLSFVLIIGFNYECKDHVGNMQWRKKDSGGIMGRVTILYHGMDQK